MQFSLRRKCECVLYRLSGVQNFSLFSDCSSAVQMWLTRKLNIADTLTPTVHVPEPVTLTCHPQWRFLPKYILMLSSHLLLGIPSGHFPEVPRRCSVCSLPHSHILNFTILATLGDLYKSRVPSLCKFTTSLLSKNIFLAALLWNDAAILTVS